MLRETNIFIQNGFGQYIILSVNALAHCSNILQSLKSIVSYRFVQTFQSTVIVFVRFTKFSPRFYLEFLRYRLFKYLSYSINIDEYSTTWLVKNYIVL